MMFPLASRRLTLASPRAMGVGVIIIQEARP